MSLREWIHHLVLGVCCIALPNALSGQPHDHPWLSDSGIHTMSDHCWGFQPTESETSEPEKAPEAEPPSGTPTSWPSEQTYRSLNRFDLLYSTPALPMDWNLIDRLPAESLLPEVPEVSEQLVLSGEAAWMLVEKIEAEPTATSVTATNVTETSLFDLSTAIELKDWFLQDLANRLKARRLTASAFSAANHLAWKAEQMVKSAFEKGLDLLECHGELLVTQESALAMLPIRADFGRQLFVIHQLDGKDFLVPGNVARHWSIVPDFSQQPIHPPYCNHEFRLPAQDVVQLNRALKDLLADHLELAAQKLAAAAENLREDRSNSDSGTVQIAEAPSSKPTNN